MAEELMAKMANANSARLIFFSPLSNKCVLIRKPNAVPPTRGDPNTSEENSAIENREVFRGRPHHLPLLTKKSCAAAFARISVQLGLFSHRKSRLKLRARPGWPSLFPERPLPEPSAHRRAFPPLCFLMRLEPL